MVIAQVVLLAAYVVVSLALAWSQIKPSGRSTRAPDLLRRALVRNF